MIHITQIHIAQIIYIKDGQENVLHQFEDTAIPIILKYNGRLLLRVRPTEEAFIEHHIDKPYDVRINNKENDGAAFKFMTGFTVGKDPLNRADY